MTASSSYIVQFIYLSLSKRNNNKTLYVIILELYNRESSTQVYHDSLVVHGCLFARNHRCFSTQRVKTELPDSDLFLHCTGFARVYAGTGFCLLRHIHRPTRYEIPS